MYVRSSSPGNIALRAGKCAGTVEIESATATVSDTFRAFDEGPVSAVTGGRLLFDNNCGAANVCARCRRLTIGFCGFLSLSHGDFGLVACVQRTNTGISTDSRAIQLIFNSTQMHNQPHTIHSFPPRRKGEGAEERGISPAPHSPAYIPVGAQRALDGCKYGRKVFAPSIWF